MLSEQRRCLQERLQERRHSTGARFLCWSLADAVVRELGYAQVVLNEWVEELDDAITTRPISDHAQHLHDLRTVLEKVVRATAPLVQALEDGAGQPAATPAHLWQSLRGELAAVNSEILSLQTRVASLQQYFRQAVEERHSRVLYVLTLVTALFVPLQFLTGVWGMNFRVMPELEWEYGYEMFWCCELLIALLVFIFFRASGLLQLS